MVRRRRRGGAAAARARREARARRARPGGTEREWCDAEVLRRLRRASLAALRREVEPVEQAALGRFLPELARDRPARVAARGAHPAAGARAAGRAVGVGAAAAPRARLPARAARPALRVGRARLGRRGARPRGASSSARTRRCSVARPRRPRPEGEAHDAIREALAGGAKFWSDARGSSDALPALWDLVWAGEVTNDAWAPLRAERRYQAPRPDRRVRRFSRARDRSRRPRRRAAGRSRRRCSTASPTGARSPSCCSSGTASSRATPSAPRGSPAATARSTASCKALETLGACRRGYFVEGLGGAQFALGGAVERLRELRPREGDEAGAARPRRRRSGAAVRRGAPVAEARGRPRSPRRGRARRPARRRAGALRRARRPLARPAPRAGRGMAPPGARRARRVRQRGRCEAPRGRALRRRAGRETDVMPLLVEAGFLAGPRRAVLRS